MQDFTNSNKSAQPQAKAALSDWSAVMTLIVVVIAELDTIESVALSNIEHRIKIGRALL